MNAKSPTYPDLENKTILLTGAIRGIGRGIALELARQKAHVVFNFRSGKETEASGLIAEIEKLGGKATSMLFDLCHEEEMRGALKQYEQDNKDRPITGLINNAGITKDGLLLRAKSADIDEVLATNLKGMILLTSIMAKSFLRLPNVSIINISSIVGLSGNAGQAVYAASKAGVIGFTKSVAKEYASRAIRCNAICPGFIQTEMTDKLDEKLKSTYSDSIPLARFGSVQDVAHATCFLMSETSSYITGVVLKVDGGLYI